MKALRLVFDADDFNRLMRALAHFPDVWPICRDHLRKVLPVHLWNRTRLGDQLLDIGFHGRNHAAHHAVVSQMAHEAAGVDVRKHRNLELLEIFFGYLLRAPIRADLRKLAHDQAFNVRARAFVVFGVGAVVADLRIG